MCKTQNQDTIPSANSTKVQNIKTTEVEVVRSVEAFTDVFLNDGTHIKVKPAVMSAIRLEDQWDSNGNPVYQISGVFVSRVKMSPDSLRKEK